MSSESISLAEAARRSGVSDSTLKRWAEQRVIPLDGGRWTPAAAAQARVVARMRERGHSLRELRAAARDGRLAFGYIEDLIPRGERGLSRREVAELVRLDEELVERIMTLLGMPLAEVDQFAEDDVEALRTFKGIIDAGYPLVALLQLVRVYAQAMRKIAEAEVRLFHHFVHEPLISDGVPALEIAEEMGGLAESLLPTVGPMMEYIHNSYLRHYMEQDVVGHMEADALSDRRAARVAMTFGFVDLTGFTRFTEEAGDEQALDLVERFVETVEATLPRGATIVKTIGDEVMIVGSDPERLTEWAVGFMTLFQERPTPRVGLHFGRAVYRDGDYYGGDVNLAHRIATRALGGEVMVTDSLVDQIGSNGLVEFDPIGDVELKGFGKRTQLFVAKAKERP